jgi:hypothetical protein
MGLDIDLHMGSIFPHKIDLWRINL